MNNPTAPSATSAPAAQPESLIEYPSLFPIKVMGLKVDGLAVGNGQPGPVSAKLYAGYQHAKAEPTP